MPMPMPMPSILIVYFCIIRMNDVIRTQYMSYPL